MSGKGFHIPSLDGLRAVSFFIVFVAHIGYEAQVPGGFGVTVFFFLSGFLITTLMRMEFEKRRDVNLKQFYLRRVLRILPPFYVVLAASLAAGLSGLVPSVIEWPAIASQALHYANYWIIGHGYTGMVTGTGVYWSLAVEEHFYFLFPWLFLGLQKAKWTGRQQGLALLGLCGLILAWRCALVFGFDANAVNNDRTYLGSDARFDSILFGSALAVGLNPVLDGEPPGSSTLWKWVLFPLGVAGLLVSFLFRHEAFRETFRYSLQGLSLVPIFVVAIRHPTFGPFRLLNLKPFAFVGLLSYSLYLVHHVVIFAVAAAAPDWHKLVRGVIALAISFALAYAIYVFIEKPCAQLRKRLSAA